MSVTLPPRDSVFPFHGDYMFLTFAIIGDQEERSLGLQLIKIPIKSKGYEIRLRER